MEKMKTVEGNVLEILRECPDARSDDMRLFSYYYNRYAWLPAGQLPLEDVAWNYKAYGLPCFESIRRARQRVQALFPELSRHTAESKETEVKIIINLM